MPARLGPSPFGPPFVTVWQTWQGLKAAFPLFASPAYAALHVASTRSAALPRMLDFISLPQGVIEGSLLEPRPADNYRRQRPDHPELRSGEKDSTRRSRRTHGEMHWRAQRSNRCFIRSSRRMSV